jgi:hypothetical protein
VVSDLWLGVGENQSGKGLLATDHFFVIITSGP